MLTTLSTLKSRLSILDTDTTNYAQLTSAIISLSGRFDKETNRTLARTVSATQEFPGNDTEILLVCYPVETVTKFETKSTELEGWQEKIGVDYLIRSSCVISLASPSSFILHPSSLCRVTYTGG